MRYWLILNEENTRHNKYEIVEKIKPNICLKHISYKADICIT